jgi:hypothetical protein
VKTGPSHGGARRGRAGSRHAAEVEGLRQDAPGAVSRSGQAEQTHHRRSHVDVLGLSRVCERVVEEGSRLPDSVWERTPGPPPITAKKLSRV